MNTECVVTMLYFISSFCLANAVRLKWNEIKAARRAEAMREQAFAIGHSVGMKGNENANS